MSSFLIKIDQLGKKFNFNIDGGKFRTKLGGIFTILLIIGLLIALWYFGREVYERKMPFFIWNQEKTEKRDWSGTLNNSNMFIAIRLKLNDTTLDDLTEIEYIFTYKQRIFNSTSKELSTSERNIKMKRCSTDHINNETLKRLGLGEFFCHNETMRAGGPDAFGSYAKPFYYIKFCDEGTEKRNGIKCKNYTTIRKKYFNQKVYVEVVYQNTFPTPGSSLTSYNSVYFSRDNGIDIIRNKENFSAFYQWIYYSISNFTTDNGWIFQDLQTVDFLELDDEKFTIEPSGNDFSRNFFFKLMLYISRKSNFYNRQYLKIPAVIASVGGVSSSTLFLLKLFFSLYLDNEFSVYMYEKMFNLNLDEGYIESISNDMKDSKDSKIINNNQIELDKSDGKINNQCVNTIRELKIIPKRTLGSLDAHSDFLNITKDSEVIILNNDISKLISKRKKKKISVNISFGERCYYILCCFDMSGKSRLTKAKIELRSMADKILDQRSEIMNVWHNFDQFKLFQKILLNESQNFMLQRRGKQQILSDGLLPTPEEVHILDEINFLKSKNILVDYFSSRKRDNKISTVDILLYNYCEEDLKNEIEKIILV